MDFNPHCAADYNPFPEESPSGPRAYCHPNLFKGATALLYRNEGGWKFTDVTEEAGVPGRGFAFGCSAADYDADGDGYDDLLVGSEAWDEGGGFALLGLARLEEGVEWLERGLQRDPRYASRMPMVIDALRKVDLRAAEA